MTDKLNYMRVVGPHRCIRCDKFECDTSEEMTGHLNSKHPGWMTETLRPEMADPKTEPTDADRERIAKALFIDMDVYSITFCEHGNPPPWCLRCKIERGAAELAAVREAAHAQGVEDEWRARAKREKPLVIALKELWERYHSKLHKGMQSVCGHYPCPYIRAALKAEGK